ncbi:MAG TPA: succinate dehydrogenase, hydrophobic membrane anchor protein [Steroidobacteraceae bacterium]|nr:succinate dehydrogenase, hydrophobic membrane anchor protein [Steroidobacteraceae bacterium]
MSLRSPLGRVLGLGAAGEGVGHWWAQRASAVALVLLTLWFVGALIALGTVDYAALVAWLQRPLSAVLMTLLVLTLVYHSVLGVQVVIEDYVSNKGTRILVLLAARFAHVLLGAIGVFAVLRIAFGGHA